MKKFGFAECVAVKPLSNKQLSKQARFGTMEFDYNPKFLYTQVRAISARVNRNYDGFRSGELKAAYHTFKGRPSFVNHNNSNPQEARGIVVASRYLENGTDRYIECLQETDPRAYPKLAAHIIAGDIDGVSMGTDVERSICSYCANVAREVEDFCDHIAVFKGSVLEKYNEKTGKLEPTLCYEDCRGLNFFELSYVFEPADETALFQNVVIPGQVRISSKTVPGKIVQGDTLAPSKVDTIKGHKSCPQCKDDNFNGIRCDWCEYTTPPKELQDPDLDKAKETDLHEKSKQKSPAKKTQQKNRTEHKNKTGEEEKLRMGNLTADQKLQQALARRRLAEAQKRLSLLTQSDLSEQDMGNADGAEDVSRTPPPGMSQWSTEGEREEAAQGLQNVQDLEQPLPPNVNFLPDDRQQVTVRQPSDNSVPQNTDVKSVAAFNGNPAMITVADIKEAGIQLLANQWIKACKSHGDSGSPGFCIIQKGTGKHLSWHTSKGKAEAAFRGMMAQKHGEVKEAEVDQGMGDTAQPDARVDVTTPVANTTDDYAQDSQYDPAAWDNNAQNLPSVHQDPQTPGGEGQGFAPGGMPWLSGQQGNDMSVPPNTQNRPGPVPGTMVPPEANQPGPNNTRPGRGASLEHFAKPASAVQAIQLAEAYIHAGLIPDGQKFSAVAAFEKIPSVIAEDRLKLVTAILEAQISQVNSVQSQPRQGSNIPANAVPVGQRRSSLSFGRTAQMNGTTASSNGDDGSTDVIAFL